MASATRWTTCLSSTGPMIERDQLAALQGENARLIALLDGHGIEWRLPPVPIPPEPAPPATEPESSRFSTAEKMSIFRRLFRGRTDVYPIRWESKTTGKSGYAPDCANEWLAGVCEKPRIKCGECNNRLLSPMRRNGARMPRRFTSRVANWVCRWPLKYHVPATARTLGFSSPAAYRLGMHVDSAPPSSATPVPALAN